MKLNRLLTLVVAFFCLVQTAFCDSNLFQFLKISPSPAHKAPLKKAPPVKASRGFVSVLAHPTFYYPGEGHYKIVKAKASSKKSKLAKLAKKAPTKVRKVWVSTSDKNTDAWRTSTAVPLRPATSSQIGIVSVLPTSVLLGSLIKTTLDGVTRYWLAADNPMPKTAKLWRRNVSRLARTPIETNALTLDFCSPIRRAPAFCTVELMKFPGPKSFMDLSYRERMAWLDPTKWGVHLPVLKYSIKKRGLMLAQSQ